MTLAPDPATVKRALSAQARVHTARRCSVRGERRSIIPAGRPST